MTRNTAPASAYAAMSKMAQEAFDARGHYEEPTVPPVASGKLIDGIRRAFDALIDPNSSFGVLPCNVNGSPGGLIVHLETVRGGVHCTPFFVSVAEGMRITDEEGSVIFGPE